jgi:hypothetical protein
MPASTSYTYNATKTRKRTLQWGNGSVMKFISAKLKESHTTYKVKTYNRRKVWTVNATDVERITFEITDNNDRKSKRD